MNLFEKLYNLVLIVSLSHLVTEVLLASHGVDLHRTWLRAAFPYPVGSSFAVGFTWLGHFEIVLAFIFGVSLLYRFLEWVCEVLAWAYNLLIRPPPQFRTVGDLIEENVQQGREVHKETPVMRPEPVIPESYRQDSPYVLMTPPPWQASIWYEAGEKLSLVGHANRISGHIVTNWHVLQTADVNKMKLVIIRTERDPVMIPLNVFNFKSILDDIVAAPISEVKGVALTGLKEAPIKHVQGFQPVYIATDFPDNNASVAGLRNCTEAWGMVQYTGSTRGGFSGAGYCHGNALFGIHSHGGTQNIGYSASYVAMKLRTPESSDFIALVNMMKNSRDRDYSKRMVAPGEWEVSFKGRYFQLDAEDYEEFTDQFGDEYDYNWRSEKRPSKGRRRYEWEHNPIHPDMTMDLIALNKQVNKLTSVLKFVRARSKQNWRNLLDLKEYCAYLERIVLKKWDMPPQWQPVIWSSDSEPSTDFSDDEFDVDAMDVPLHRDDSPEPELQNSGVDEGDHHPPNFDDLVDESNPVHMEVTIEDCPPTPPHPEVRDEKPCMAVALVNPLSGNAQGLPATMAGSQSERPTATESPHPSPNQDLSVISRLDCLSNGLDAMQKRLLEVSSCIQDTREEQRKLLGRLQPEKSGSLKPTSASATSSNTRPIQQLSRRQRRAGLASRGHSISRDPAGSAGLKAAAPSGKPLGGMASKSPTKPTGRPSNISRPSVSGTSLTKSRAGAMKSVAPSARLT